MITIKNVLNLDGLPDNVSISSAKEHIIEADKKWTLLPGLVDSHIHFGPSGVKSGAFSALSGGITSFIDIPTDVSPCSTLEQLNAKKQLIERQLAEAKIPLRPYFFLGADEKHFEQIGRAKDKIVGVSIISGDNYPNMSDKGLDNLFRICAQEDLVIAVHPYEHHSIKKLEYLISLAEKYDAQIYIFHIHTAEEVALVRKAKQREILVYAETSPLHLFLLDAKRDSQLPVKPIGDQHALWEGIRDETIDSIGVDHGHHVSLEESPLENFLPLFLNACHEGSLNILHLMQLTSQNIQRIFRLQPNEDKVLVDLNYLKELTIRGQEKRIWGWPVYTIVNGEVFRVGA